jgi:diguanylate cyclase (GGDEF)-like protein
VLPLRSFTPILVSAAFALVTVAALVPQAIHVALPLGAFGIATLILVSRPRNRAWRWAAIGSVLWGAEEVVWSVVRVTGSAYVTGVTDTLFYAGAALWLVALWSMPGKRRPIGSLALTLPALVLVAWLLLMDVGLSLYLGFPWVELALLLFSLPAIEAALRGRASEGRLLWGLGFMIRALAAGNLTWLLDVSDNLPYFSLLWLVSYAFVAIGVWIELNNEEGKLWSAATIIIGLEAVIGTLLLLLFQTETIMTTVVPLAILFGYILFSGIIMLIAADRRRRMQAERQLASWSDLLERLVTFRPDSGDILGTLTALMNDLSATLPGLQGIDVELGDPHHVGTVEGYAYPMVKDGTTLGHLHFRLQPQPGSLVDTLAPLVASRIEEGISQARWQSQAITDALTGLFNRRGFHLKRQELTVRARERQARVSVAMLDLDHFKRVNDFHGHAVGDEALRIFASILKRNTRQDDLAVRWGGEEFMLVLYDTDANSAAEVIDRIRSELRDKVIRPIGWPLTLSAGLAGGEVPSDIGALTSWIETADVALLAAKEGGRDRLERSALPR